MRRTVDSLLALLLLCGCVHAFESPVWLDVPFVKQETDGCGAASIAMVMQYWAKQSGKLPGDAMDAAVIQRALYSRTAHGIYASQMENYLREHGFRTFSFSGTWEDLEQHLQKGRPVIVAIKVSRDVLHYVVVAGIDRDRSLVKVNDPARRKLFSYDRSEFERQWNATANWTLLALPQHGGQS